MRNYSTWDEFWFDWGDIIVDIGKIIALLAACAAIIWGVYRLATDLDPVTVVAKDTRMVRGTTAWCIQTADRRELCTDNRIIADALEPERSYCVGLGFGWIQTVRPISECEPSR